MVLDLTVSEDELCSGSCTFYNLIDPTPEPAQVAQNSTILHHSGIKGMGNPAHVPTSRGAES